MNRTRRMQRATSPDICTPPRGMRSHENFINPAEELVDTHNLEINIPCGLELPLASTPQKKGFSYDDLFHSHKEPSYTEETPFYNVMKPYAINPDPILSTTGLNDTSLNSSEDTSSINTPPHGSPCGSVYSQDPETMSIFQCEIPESPVCEDTELMANRERTKSSDITEKRPGPSALRKSTEAKKPRLTYAEGDSLVTVHKYSNPTDAFPSVPVKSTDHEVYHRPGKICRMQLTNFMCHEKFDKKWNIKVNFVTGENGSGKSAIVNAIILNLGGTAKMTERVDKASSFIMKGKQFAKIDITYTNDGTLNLAKYGRFFTISRTIKYKKSSDKEEEEKMWKYDSTYKISTPDKKWRKLKRSELNLIKLTLQIMVENPAMFLTQENSRNFGKLKDPGQLYKIYYEGMSLSASEKYSLNATSNIQMSKGLLDAKQKILEDMAFKVKRLNEEYELIKKLENKAETKELLKLEHAWALVAVEEAREKIKQKQYNANQLECTKLEEEIERIEDEQHSFAEAKMKREVLKAKLTKYLKDKREEEQTNAHQLRKLLGETAPIDYELKIRNAKIKKLVSEIRDFEEKIKRAKMKSENEMKRIQDEANAHKERILSRKEELRNKLLEEQKAKEVINQEVKTMQAGLRELREKDSEAKTALKIKQAELKAIHEKKSSKYSRFGAKMVNLMNLIEEHAAENKFIEVPQGPQAACYTVKDKFKEYTPMIELIMGGTLFQFRVTNKQDCDLLNKLIKQAFGPKKNQSIYPHILLHRVRNPEKFVLMRMVNRNNERFDTVLDALDVLDPTTSQWLVDANQIERRLLFETTALACDVMKDQNRVPTGCLNAYTLQKDRVRPSPNYGKFVEYPKNKAAYVQVTTKLPNDELVKAEIKDLEKDCRAIAAMKRAREDECEQLRKRAFVHEKNCKVWSTELIKLEAEMLSIMTEMNKLPDLVSLETQLEDTKDLLAEEETLKLNLETSLEKFSPQFKTVEEKQKTITMEIFNHEKEISMLEADEDNDSTPQDLVIELKKKNDILAKRKAASERLANELRDINDHLQQLTLDASSQGVCVGYRREPSEIQQEINELDELIRKNNHKIYQKYKVKEEIDCTKQIAEKIGLDINIVRKLIIILEPMLKVQSEEFERAKGKSGQSLKVSYYSLITSRNYKGNLVLDHEKRTLDFYQAADDNSYKRAKSIRANEKFSMTDSEKNIINRERKDNQRMASGGERSFATICFMVSMWKIMEVPFIVQDEFDIFMDNINRETVQRILIDHTMNQPEAQFTFLTPLALDISCSKDITIWRLYPPVRGKDDENNEQQTQMNIFEESGPSSRTKNSNTVDDDFILMPTLEKQIDTDSPPPVTAPKRRRKQ